MQEKVYIPYSLTSCNEHYLNYFYLSTQANPYHNIILEVYLSKALDTTFIFKQYTDQKNHFAFTKS